MSASPSASEDSPQQLDRALVSGMAWTAVMRWSSQIVSWVATFYVARILVPADYGIVGMATLAIGFARMVEDFGLDSIFVQDRTIGGEQQARLAGFILVIGVGLCLLFVGLSLPIASFFKEPNVVWAVCGMSLLFITDALQVIPRALLQRELQFNKLALLAFAQMVVTQSALLFAALSGWGFKALIFNSLIGGVFATVVLFYLKPYAIAWPRNMALLARPLLQGWRVLASRIAYYAYISADSTIIGRFLGKDALGAYSFAQTLSTTAVQEVSSVVSKVVPGVFSATQYRRDELKRYYLLLTELVVFLTFPMAIGLALTADLVVEIVLGPQWTAVVAPLRILSLYAAWSNSQLLMSHLLMWTGQFRLQMWATLATTAVLPIAFYVGVRWGLEGVAWMWATVYPITCIPGIIFGFRTISISLRHWLGAIYPAIVACVLMSAAVLIVRSRMPETSSTIVECGLAVGTGALVYVATVAVLFHRRIRVLWELLRHVRSTPKIAPVAPEAA